MCKNLLKNVTVFATFFLFCGFQILGAAKKPGEKPEGNKSESADAKSEKDEKKKIEAYPRDISIQMPVNGTSTGSVMEPKATECLKFDKNLCFAFKVKTPEEEMKIRELATDNKLGLNVLNGMLIERNYFKCFDPGKEYVPAFCFGSISVSSHVFIDAFGQKEKNKDFNIKDPIYFDANFANIDFLWDNRWLGIGAAAATSTINLQKVIIFKAGLIVQSENLRAEFGWLRAGFDGGDNNGLYFGIGVPLISYASALKEKVAAISGGK